MATMIKLECGFCGKTFERRKGAEKKWSKSYCSRKCLGDSKRTAQLDFWSLVDRASADGCWPWLGGVDSNGYGFFEESRKHVIAHRRAYELTYGPIPHDGSYHGTVIRHTCDNPPCCRPDHLVPGTQTQNMTDMVSRRRMKLKLTEDQVRAIREDGRDYGEICADYGISKPTISDIKSRTTWKHVD